MPYINTIANVPIPKEAREILKARIGQYAEMIGKKESQLMVDFRESSPLYFQGSDAPAAIVSVDVYGGAPKEDYDRFALALTKLLDEVLNIPATRVFIKLAEYPYWAAGQRLVDA